MKHYLGLLFGSVLAALIINTAQAENRALLIGVGQFAELGIAPLPGISTDIENMHKAALEMGFTEQQILTLLNQSATLENIENAIIAWLGDSRKIGPDDRLLLYFSGHGTRIPDLNGDEDDQADESLIPYDVKLGHSKDQPFENVLLDDHFGQLLSALPSRDIFVLIDACHSGTSTKSLRLSSRSLIDVEAVPKFLDHPAGLVATGGLKRNFFVEKNQPQKNAEDNYIVLTAARDDQRAIATKQGSTFTLAVAKTIIEASQAKQKLTVRQLRDHAARFIQREVSAHLAHEPQVGGNLALLDKELVSIPAAEPRHEYGELWRKLVAAVANSATVPIQIRTNQPHYKLGDVLELIVDIPRSGYLNIINVNAHDNAVVLFPNKFHADNKVKAGQLTIPTEQMSFRLRAGEPVGPSLIVAFLTARPIDAYQGGESLGAQDVFRALSANETRNFNVESTGNAHQFAAGMKQTRVCAADCQ